MTKRWYKAIRRFNTEGTLDSSGRVKKACHESYDET
jgi:hypothetical protein